MVVYSDENGGGRGEDGAESDGSEIGYRGGGERARSTFDAMDCSSIDVTRLTGSVCQPSLASCEPDNVIAETESQLECFWE